MRGSHAGHREYLAPWAVGFGDVFDPRERLRRVVPPADDRGRYEPQHGLIGLTRTLAAEWGGRGVRANALCPGWVKTEMDATDQASGGYTDSDIVERVPMARFAAPGDIAQAAAFLADPARSGFINGAALPVDGGWTADASWNSLRMRKR